MAFLLQPLAIGARALVAALCALVFAAAAATQYVADVFDHQRALGSTVFGGIYTPWSIFDWRARWSDTYRRPFAVADLILVLGFSLAVVVAAMAARKGPAIKPFGRGAWATKRDLRSAELFADTGAIIGKFEGELLCFDGPGHQLLVGASRSGKGRGQVVPTLLAWPDAALVLDIKGELADGDPRHHFPGTSGFRETLGPVLRFAPTVCTSVAFNPLFEVRKGANEVRDVQNIVEILVDPAGDGRHQDFWDRSAKTILVGLILHVLYAEPIERKTLAVVREKLRDLDATAQAMKSTLHRLSASANQPETHAEVLHAAESFLGSEERVQSGVKATAKSLFGVFADPIVAEKTARSDFRIADLMCAEKPVTLFLQPPPSDAMRLMPLLRLVLNQIARALMESQTHGSDGRVKRHRLLICLDEFPMLGRMSFFETMMGAMAGYGLKVFLVTQSLNHLTKAYGRDNVILDNVHIVTSFAAADGDTAKRVAEMAGDVWELRESETHARPKSLLGLRKGSTTIREERRPLLLPADVRALPRDQQLIFVSGEKPIRARKIKFDEEPVFVERLRPAAPQHATLTTTHDWADVRSLGTVPGLPKRIAAKMPMSKPQVDQPDLFAQAALRAGKISKQAMAGFRAADGSALAHPSTRFVATSPSVGPAAAGEPRSRKAKGI